MRRAKPSGKELSGAKQPRTPGFQRYLYYEYMAQEQAALERRTRRSLVIVSIVCLFIVLLAFVTAAKQSRRIPYSRALWDSGKGMYTTNNPRLKMAEDIERRISSAQQDHHPMTKRDIEEMLGPSEPRVTVYDPKVMTPPAVMASNDYISLLGIRPKNIMRNEMLAEMHVTFTPTGGAAYAYTDETDFPPGAKIVPAKTFTPPPPPALPKPKPTHKPVKKGP